MLYDERDLKMEVLRLCCCICCIHREKHKLKLVLLLLSKQNLSLSVHFSLHFIISCLFVSLFVVMIRHFLSLSFTSKTAKVLFTHSMITIAFYNHYEDFRFLESFSQEQRKKI